MMPGIYHATTHSVQADFAAESTSVRKAGSPSCRGVVGLATIVMMNDKTISGINEREEAYIYDLYIAPQWSEPFNQLFDDEVKLPKEGKILDAGTGTGGLALDLAANLGARSTVVGVDRSAERIELARAKAQLKKLENLTFRVGSLDATGLPDKEFDLVIGDASMHSIEELPAISAELHRVANDKATLAMLLTTHGSFDEFFSILWESLYELDLLSYTPDLEEFLTAQLKTSDAEAMVAKAGWKRVRSVTRKERFDYTDAQAFLTAPLIENYYLPRWLALLPDEEARYEVLEALARIIDRERQGMDFDVSIKATIIIGKK
jgi:ubiquinone/menaquinone biosynthesis C-methylase UbiE